MFGTKKGGVAPAPVKGPISGAKSASGKAGKVVQPEQGKSAPAGGSKAK